MITALFAALGAVTMAALWVARRAEARTAALLATVPGFRQAEDPDLWRAS